MLEASNLGWVVFIVYFGGLYIYIQVIIEKPYHIFAITCISVTSHMACIKFTTSVYVICVLHICNMYNLCLSGSFFLASVCNELSLVGFETQLPEL